MLKKSSSEGINTKKKIKNDGIPRQPNERDEAPEEHAQPRNKIKQAAIDLENGLVDTDLHGQRGVEEVTRKK